MQVDELIRENHELRQKLHDKQSELASRHILLLKARNALEALESSASSEMKNLSDALTAEKSRSAQLERALVASQQDAHRHLSSSQSVAPPISEIDQNLLQTAQVQLQQLQHQLLRANELLSNERNRTSALQSELSQAVDKATQAQNTCQQLRAAREADAATWQKQHANDMTTLQAHHQREIAMMKEQLQRTQRSESEFAERRQQTSQQLQNRVDELTSAAESLTERLVAARAHAAEMSERLSEARATLDESKRAQQQSETALSKVEIRCAELEETLEQSEKRNGVLKEQFSASEEQHSKLQHHVEALSAEVDLLRSYVRTRDTALTERGHSIDSLQAQLDAIRRAVLPQTAMSDSEQSFFTSLLGKPAVVENTQPLSAGTVEILQALDQQLAELQNLRSENRQLTLQFDETRSDCQNQLVRFKADLQSANVRAQEAVDKAADDAKRYLDVERANSERLATLKADLETARADLVASQNDAKQQHKRHQLQLQQAQQSQSQQIADLQAQVSEWEQRVAECDERVAEASADARKAARSATAELHQTRQLLSQANDASTRTATELVSVRRAHQTILIRSVALAQTFRQACVALHDLKLPSHAASDALPFGAVANTTAKAAEQHVSADALAHAPVATALFDTANADELRTQSSQLVAAENPAPPVLMLNRDGADVGIDEDLLSISDIRSAAEFVAAQCNRIQSARSAFDACAHVIEQRTLAAFDLWNEVLEKREAEMSNLETLLRAVTLTFQTDPAPIQQQIHALQSQMQALDQQLASRDMAITHINQAALQPVVSVTPAKSMSSAAPLTSNRSSAQHVSFQAVAPSPSASPERQSLLAAAHRAGVQWNASATRVHDPLPPVVVSFQETPRAASAVPVNLRHQFVSSPSVITPRGQISGRPPLPPQSIYR